MGMDLSLAGSTGKISLDGQQFSGQEKNNVSRSWPPGGNDASFTTRIDRRFMVSGSDLNSYAVSIVCFMEYVVICIWEH